MYIYGNFKKIKILGRGDVMKTAYAGKTNGLLGFTEYRSLRYRIMQWVMVFILLLLSFACILPIIWIFFAGFKTTSELYTAAASFLPQTIDLSKPVEVWKSLSFGKYYLNTFVMLLGCLGTGIFCNGLMGFVLSMLKPRGAVLISLLLLWSMLIPSSLNMVPLFASFIDVPVLHFNLANTYIPMWLMSGANAFYALLFKNFFQSLPKSFVDSAKIDGCTNMQIFMKIILPLSKPVVTVAAILIITETWSSFLWPFLVITDRELVPITVKVFLLKSSGITTDRYIFTILFTMIPPMILYCLFSKQIIGSFHLYGIKD